VVGRRRASRSNGMNRGQVSMDGSAVAADGLLVTTALRATSPTPNRQLHAPNALCVVLNMLSYRKTGIARVGIRNQRRDQPRGFQKKHGVVTALSVFGQESLPAVTVISSTI
jgi:hypothetical protein